MINVRTTRRQILRATGIGTVALVSPFVLRKPASAKSDRLVIGSWGGGYDDALKKYAAAPFEAATGVRVVFDGPPNNAKIKMMVESGAPEWDMVLTDIPSILTLRKDKLLQPIEYTKIKKEYADHIPAELRDVDSVGQYVFSINMVYNTHEMAEGKRPSNWAEFWDGNALPGSRTMNFGGGTAPQLEFALLADGVPIESLYPLDVERAWKKMEQLRPLVGKWYTSHSEALQLIAAGEAAVGCTNGARGIVAGREGLPVATEFNEGKISPDSWCILTNSQQRDAAHEFINFAISDEVQEKIARDQPYGPTNLRAIERLEPELRKTLPTAPENLSRSFWWDVNWWSSVGSNGMTQRESQAKRYVEWMNS